MLDTSVIIALERRRRDGEEVAHLLPDDSFIAAIAVAELWIGVHLAKTSAQRRERLGFLQLVLSSVPVVPFGLREAEAYAQLVATLCSRGLKIGDRDAQIIATALASGHDAMSYNVAEFSRVPGLKLRPTPPA